MKTNITAILLAGIMAVFSPGCVTQRPYAEEKLLPHVPEPEFQVCEYMPKDKVLEATYPRTIKQILDGRDFIIRHFRDVMVLTPHGFAYEKSQGVKIGDHIYRRDIYVYTYHNIETMHGPPDQEIMIWYDFEDYKGTNIWKVFTGEPRWHL
jgi:hypothetical protein